MHKSISRNNPILGFDFGMKHIGVAVGQPITMTARGLTVLKAINGIPQWESVSNLIKEWGPGALIVGIPLNMDDTTQPLTHSALQFKESLEKKFNLPVYTVDERLTTKEAKARLFEEGGYKNLTKKNIDQYSAKLILESWFHSLNY